MPILDLTGPIARGMWSYDPPYPIVTIEELPIPPWVSYPTYSWKFSLGGQTGTYLETGLHVKRGRPPVMDIPIESLVDRSAVVLHVPGKDHATDAITQAEIEAACRTEIQPGDAVLISVGRDDKWFDTDYVKDSPFLLREAMDWILDRKPFLIGCDWPRMDSWRTPQRFFHRFFDDGVLLLAPLVNLRQIPVPRVALTVLPLKIAESAAAPARVFARY